MAVNVNSEDVLKVCRVLSEAENLFVKTEEADLNSILGVLGTASLAGTLLAGFKGLLLGIILASSIGCTVLAQERRKSVTEIIRCHMTSEQKQKLANSIMAAVLNVGIEDPSELMVLTLTNMSIKRTVMNEMEIFFKNEMALPVTTNC